MVSVEPIYQFVRSDKAKGGDLYKYLRHKLKHHKRAVRKNKSKIKDKISTDLSIEKVNNREKLGHFEIVLTVASYKLLVSLTITERVSKFFMSFTTQKISNRSSSNSKP